jgi:hypothetical protein
MSEMFRWLPLFVTTALAACSSAPDDRAIDKAVRSLFEEQSRVVGQNPFLAGIANAGGYEGVDVKSADKVGCAEAAENIYDCTVIVEYVVRCKPESLMMMATTCNKPVRSSATYRFLRSSKGWEMRVDG